MPTGPGPTGSSGLWFVVGTSRGTATKAFVVGPFPTKAAFLAQYGPNPYIDTKVLGNPNGYPDQPAAQAYANHFNGLPIGQRVAPFGGHVAPNISLPNPLSGLAQIGAIAQAIFGAITDLAMWRCLGWIAAGAVMIAIGVRLWLGMPAVPNFIGGPGGAPTIIPV